MGKPQSDEKAEVKTRLNDNARDVPDGGFGWFVSIAAFVVQFIILGLQNNLGMFHVEHLKDFQKSKLETGWVSSLALGNMFLFAPLTSALCEKYGCRRVGFCGGVLTVIGMLASSFATSLYMLYFTFGIVYGIGTSMCYFPTLRTLPYWFSRNLALANGIAAAGSGVGTVAVGPLLEELMSSLGWKHTARIFAGLLLIPTFAALVYCVPSTCHKGEKGDEKPKTKILDLSVLKNPAFIVLCVAMSVFMLGYFVPFIHLPQCAQDMNVPKKESSYLVGIMSVGSTFGRLFFGKLSDHPRVNRLYLYQMAFLCIGIVDTLVPQITNFAGYAMYMVSFGVFDGCFIVLLAIVVSDVVGIDKVSPGMGIKFFFMAITTFVGPPLAGWLVDISGSYDLAFYAAGGTSAVAFGLLFLVPVLMPPDVRTRNRTAYEIGDEEMADEEDALYEKKYLPDDRCEKTTCPTDSDPTSTDSSLLSPTLRSPQFLRVQARDPTKRASWLEANVAMVGGDPNVFVVERMTTV